MSKTAQRIVERIIDDLTDRKGLRHEWDNIDELTQYEIAQEWQRIVDEERE